jgi:hypothetical protein
MERPAKARPDFPLFARANGQWAKKIQGKLHYFGAWDDPGTAEDNYHRQEPELDGNRKTKHKQSKLRREKPNKPRPDYPLYPHPSGQWACKVGRQTNYFGPWDDPEGAERAYQDYVSNESTKTVRNSKAARTEETPRKPRKTFPLGLRPRTSIGSAGGRGAGIVCLRSQRTRRSPICCPSREHWMSVRRPARDIDR